MVERAYFGLSSMMVSPEPFPSHSAQREITRSVSSGTVFVLSGGATMCLHTVASFRRVCGRACARA
jgi:hypothetical protein